MVVWLTKRLIQGKPRPDFWPFFVGFLDFQFLFLECSALVCLILIQRAGISSGFLVIGGVGGACDKSVFVLHVHCVCMSCLTSPSKTPRW